MTPKALSDRISELGLSQRRVAVAWRISEDTISRWATGKLPIPGWVGYALDGIEHRRLVKLAADRSYPWPPIGYS